MLIKSLPSASGIAPQSHRPHIVERAILANPRRNMNDHDFDNRSIKTSPPGGTKKSAMRHHHGLQFELAFNLGLDPIGFHPRQFWPDADPNYGFAVGFGRGYKSGITHFA